MASMLAQSATWISLVGADGASTCIHYPSVSVGDSAAAQPPTSALIEPSSDGSKVSAPGILLPDGQLTVILRQSEVTAAAIEANARAIAYEVTRQSVGLPITGHKLGLCSMPDPASRAAQETSDEQSLGLVVASRTIPIIFTYAIG
jgi:hypothetical protein